MNLQNTTSTSEAPELTKGSEDHGSIDQFYGWDQPTHSEASVKFRTRRSHPKSRNGYFECKRRKVKCDEGKPTCSRCLSSLQKCIYPYRLAPSAPDDQRNEISLPSPPSSIVSSSSYNPPCSARSLLFQTSRRSPPASVESDICVGSTVSSLQPSDTDLYHHYLQHTSRTLTHCQRDQSAFQIGMPTLAMQSKTVFHSLLALSVACLCRDMISEDPSRDTGAVSQLLITAYRHYHLASERMRHQMSCSNNLKPEPLFASTVLLVPFASATQQISHWISNRTGPKGSHIQLATTPRDIIVIMRGVQTMLQSLDYKDASSTVDFQSPSPPPSHTHVMFPILAATSQGALSKLQERLSNASVCHNDTYCEKPCSEQFPDDSLSACSAAFDILNNIALKTFSGSNLSASASQSNTIEEALEPKDFSRPQGTPWLRAYASRAADPLPTEPLTRFFLTFLVQTPQTYLDLILPLLDQRLETPISAPSDSTSTELTKTQALALDIYAHWSVLMFLLEDESWWIGGLPVITLTGMINRYGGEFVARLWPQCGHGELKWWPASMLTILREIKRSR
ncbi:hypothetical protein V8E51_010615 [Hyaloscypha variabilis]